MVGGVLIYGIAVSADESVKDAANETIETFRRRGWGEEMGLLHGAEELIGAPGPERNTLRPCSCGSGLTLVWSSAAESSARRRGCDVGRCAL